MVFPDRKKYKIDYSDEIMDLVMQLLERDKTKRLGYKDDFAEILSHPVFANIDIQKLEKGQIPPPFKPSINQKDISKYFNVQDSSKAMQDTYIPRDNQKIVKTNKDVFNDFNLKKRK